MRRSIFGPSRTAVYEVFDRTPSAWIAVISDALPYQGEIPGRLETLAFARIISAAADDAITMAPARDAVPFCHLKAERSATGKP
jgi:hypothetical protein